MKTIRTLIICLLLLTENILFAQTRFVTDGTIEFEKSINAYAVIKRQVEVTNYTFDAQMFDQFKKNQPQFKTFNSTLSFSKDKTLFEPVPVADNKYINFITGNPVFEQNNTIYTDLSANSMTSQKKVFEQSFLLKDSTRKITWKITDETRDIAGYSCRRANGIMLDSVYVVAFYAEAIPLSGGPESFSGLPGMILGVALPHDNVTWFAKKVNDKTVPPLKAPTKGKAISNKELKTTIESALKNWGKQMPLMLKGFLL
jgi:GLPGLI family protein